MTRETDASLYTAFQSSFPPSLDDTLLTTAGGQRFSYADAVRESARLASCLVAQGAAPGDRVTVQVEKSPHALWLYLACLRAGLVYHPLNTAYQADELAYFLGDAEPRIVICGVGAGPLFRELTAESDAVVLTLDADAGGTLMALAQGAEAHFDTVPRGKDDLAALLYSSGTTGRPKGIMLSHGNLVSNGRTLVQAWGFTREDCLLHALPVFHVHGLFVAISCVMLSGASMCWLDRFDAREVMRSLPQCSVMMGVPTYYTRLLAEPDFGAEQCGAMRLFVSGSAPLLVATFEEFQRRTGHAIVERYGMTETNMNISNPLHGERRAGTVGLPLPEVEVRIVDAEGTAVPDGETGSLQVRGPNVFRGYWRMPDKTREDFTEDGFFNTGDQAMRSADGYYSIVGRAKDMVITGGLNVYPKEVEQFLDELDGVRESAVIGVPHPDFGEAVVAVIVPSADSRRDGDAIIAAARERIAAFKVPKQVHFVDELPRNAMGKVQKNLLRERFASGA